MKKQTPISEVDSLDELCETSNIAIGPTDGLLLVRFTEDGRVLPSVLRLGLMTEGRMEASIMPIYLAINRARVIEANKRRL